MGVGVAGLASGSSGRRFMCVVALALSGGGVLVACGGSGGGSPAQAVVAVMRERAAAPGADPFTASVAVDSVVNLSANVRTAAAEVRKALHADPATQTLAATGTAPGLYGGSGDTQVCDPQQLVTFLDQHADKEKAWADVLGIAPSAVAGYVATLTPVLLTSDTLVTNHGYRNGVATARTSVLQAGTAVMVDARGVPRVKCNCGNPLTSPQAIALAKAKTTGPTWSGYSPDAVTTVKPGARATTLTLVDVTTGSSYVQPTGGAEGPRLTDGTYNLSMTDPGADVCGFGLGNLNHQQLVVQGDTARITAPPDREFRGTVQRRGDAFTIKTTMALPQPQDFTAFTIVGTVGNGEGFEGTSMFSDSNPQLASGTSCRYPVIGILSRTPVARRTTATTTPARPDVRTLPAGLKCKELHDRGYSFAEVVDYWEGRGRPALMDADGNGVPCETVYPASEVSAIFGNTSGSPACLRSRIVTNPGPHQVIDSVKCIGPWAAVSSHDSQTGDEFGVALLHWTGSAWQPVQVGPDSPYCTGPGAPAEFHNYACGTG